MTPGVRRFAMVLTAGTCALTTWVYPYHEKELVALSGIATVPLIARNVLFFFLVVLLEVHAWRAGGRDPRKMDPPERADAGRAAGAR